MKSKTKGKASTTALHVCSKFDPLRSSQVSERGEKSVQHFHTGMAKNRSWSLNKSNDSEKNRLIWNLK